MKKAFQYVLFLSIGAGLLFLTFRNTNPTVLWDNIRTVDSLGLLLTLGIGFIAIVFRGIRWVQLLGSLGYEVKAINAIAAVAFSYLVNLVTPRVGEVARCSAMNRTDKVPVDKLLGTVVLERVVDTLMFGLVVLITVVTQLNQLGKFLRQSGAAVPEISTVSVLIALGGCMTLITCLWATKKYWSSWTITQKILTFLRGISEGLKSIKNVQNKPLFWFYSIGIWICYVGTIWVGFSIVQGLSELGIGTAFYISVAAGIGYVIPVPGGIGAYHYLVSKALTVLGYSSEIGIAFATVIHSGQSLMFITTGSIAMLILYFARKK
jgi:uncharacterized protein (TIRG00374 family)